MVPPQSTSWRICSVVVPVGANCGVPAAGTADTGPVAAAAGLSAAAPTASTATTVRAPFHATHPIFDIMPSPGLSLKCWCPPRRAGRAAQVTPIACAPGAATQGVLAAYGVKVPVI